MARMELPYLRLARQALASEDWETLMAIEQELDASKWSAELRTASVAQGRGRLRLLRKLYPNCEQMETYHARQQQRLVFGHHCVVTALQSILLEMPLAACLLAYAYQSLANYASAAIKLLRLSRSRSNPPDAGNRGHPRMGGGFDARRARCGGMAGTSLRY